MATGQARPLRDSLEGSGVTGGSVYGLTRDDLIAIARAFPPSEELPQFDVPRFWSNPKLSDPDTIISLVLDRPTTEDLARTVVAFGAQRVLDIFERLQAQNAISDARAQHTASWLGPVMKGVANAARQLNPA